MIPTPRPRTAALPQPWLRALSLIFLGVVLVLPVWLVRYPPLLDYPNHLASGFVLAHLHDPRFHFSEFYRAQWDAYPYVLPDAILSALESLLPAELAGRIVLSACLVAPPLAAWMFLRQANRAGEGLALWTLAISYTAFFWAGFLEYELGIAACFIALGLWLRYLERPSAGRWVGLVAVLTVTYATHLIGFVVAGVVTTTLLLVRRLPLRACLSTWLLFLPGCVLFLHVIGWGTGVSGGVMASTMREKVSALWGVFRGSSLQSDLVALIPLTVSVAVARWRNPDFRWNTDWLAVVVALLALYALLPFGFGVASRIDRRVLPFLFIFALATVRVGSRARWLAAMAIVVFLLRTWDAGRSFVAAQPHLMDLAASFEAIPVHARVLPAMEHTANPRLDAHFWAHGVIARGWLSPYLFAYPGVHSLRLSNEVYAPPKGGYFLEETAPDWKRVWSSYDAIWALNVCRFAPQLRAVGTLVYTRELATGDRVDVYRIDARALPRP